jgi:hypothetical protein
MSGSGFYKDKTLLDHYLSLGYSRNDRVGKSYLEYQYESLLQGQKETRSLPACPFEITLLPVTFPDESVKFCTFSF